jgi:hypothetical protein
MKTIFLTILFYVIQFIARKGDEWKNEKASGRKAWDYKHYIDIPKSMVFSRRPDRFKLVFIKYRFSNHDMAAVEARQEINGLLSHTNYFQTFGFMIRKYPKSIEFQFDAFTPIHPSQG